MEVSISESAVWRVRCSVGRSGSAAEVEADEPDESFEPESAPDLWCRVGRSGSEDAELPDAGFVTLAPGEGPARLAAALARALAAGIALAGAA